MGWLIAVIFVVAVIVIWRIKAKKDAAESEAYKLKVLNEFAERDRLWEEERVRRERLALKILDRLPIEDPDKSPLLHGPLYDCATDEFELPCANSYFASEYSTGPEGIGWIRSIEEVREFVKGWVGCRPDPRCVAVVDGKRYLAIFWTDYPSEPGASGWRLVRTGPEKWFCWWWRAGMRLSASDVDPNFMVADLAMDPSLWPRLMEETRVAREANSEFRYALGECTHRK